MPTNGLDLELQCYTVHGTKFEVRKRYTVLEPVGQGAYGVVCAAQDEEADESVAIKKIEGVFEHFTFSKRTLRELRILRHLRHENLVTIKDIFFSGTKEDFGDIYLAFELLGTDLASIVKSSQPLSDDHCQFFLYQILRGMKYVHSADVIHRDIKPRNLLVNSNCDLKICDFGLARATFSDKACHVCAMTEYVCTRWYRAMEVLCSWTDYSKAIDLWSIGCTFAEMLTRKPLFPGHNTQHQLKLIIDLLGTPPREELRKIPNEKCRKFVESLPGTGGKSLESVLPEGTAEQLEFLRQTLQFSSDRRCTVEQALEFPYLAQLYCPEDEPTRDPLDQSDFEFERRKVTAEAVREELFLEVIRYYPEKRKVYLEEQEKSGQGYDVTSFRLLAQGESQYSSSEGEEDG